MADSTNHRLRPALNVHQKAILYQAATEPPGSSQYLTNDRSGVYHCLGCQAPLFASHQQFDSGTGWPSFSDPINDQALSLIPDHSLGQVRQEVRCRSCQGHLGHFFQDANRQPTTNRYCINGSILDFKETDQ